MSDEQKCPSCIKCGSTAISRERRPNGNDRCLDCGTLWSSVKAEFVEKEQNLCDFFEKLMELYKTGHVFKFDGSSFDRPYLDDFDCGFCDGEYYHSVEGSSVEDIKKRLQVFKKVEL